MKNASRNAFRTCRVTRSSLAGAREPLHSSVVYLTKTKSGYVPREFTTIGLGAHA